MDKNAEYYRQLLATLIDRLEQGDRDIESLVSEARQNLQQHDLSSRESEEVERSVRRDLMEFARGQDESGDDDSVFMQIVRASIWRELAEVTDKTQLEWQEIFQDFEHHGIYQSGEMIGLGNLVCEQCQFSRAIYTPELLTPCLRCGHIRFHRQPFDP